MGQTYKKYIRLNSELGLRRFGSESGISRFIFFPFVGGHSLAFKTLADALPDDWEIWAIDPPGHGWSNGELLTNFNNMVDLYFKELAFLLKENVYLFGHSLGGLIVYRLTQLLEKLNIIPGGIFIGASPLPHRISEYEYLLGKDDSQLIDTMIEFGGIPEVFQYDRDLILPYIESMRADIKAFLDTKIQQDPSLKTPITIFYSKEDTFIPHENISEWDFYGQHVNLVEIGGKHIFIQSHSHALANKITELIYNDGL